MHRHGNPSRALDALAPTGDTATQNQIINLAKEIGVPITDLECVALIRAMGGSQAGGVSKAKFESFFSVGVRGGGVNRSDGDNDRKLERWRRVRASRYVHICVVCVCMCVCVWAY
jgi:hypothetical protein